MLTFHSFDLELVWNFERGILEFLGCAVYILLCLFLLHGRQARSRGDGLFLSSIFPSAHLLLSFSLSCRCGQGQRQRQGESMIWDTLAFDPDDMRYFCSWCGLFAEVLSGGNKAEYFERLC